MDVAWLSPRADPDAGALAKKRSCFVPTRVQRRGKDGPALSRETFSPGDAPGPSAEHTEPTEEATEALEMDAARAALDLGLRVRPLWAAADLC